MQVVIDVDDKVYEMLKDKNDMFIVSGVRSGKSFALNVCNAIANGTPLRKGHGRLIDADKLEKVMYDKEKRLANEAALWRESKAMLNGIAIARWYIDNARTVIKADKDG